jgi:citrate lyase subunit beta/citryl-CoA lyase
MMRKAQSLPADQVFLDLEDSVAPDAKIEARALVIEALNGGDWSGKSRVVRINAAGTELAREDVRHVVGSAGANLDCIMLPKAESADQLRWLDDLLTEIERGEGLPVGGIGIEVLIESPAGVTHLESIASSSRRIEALVFGAGDFMAAMKMPALTIGAPVAGQTDPLDTVMVMIAIAARTHGLQVIDGPFALIRDNDGYRRCAQRAARFGFDGKWALHPDQIGMANETFTPAQSDYDKAELILEALDHFASEAGGRRGAAMLGDEMIDEASRKLATVTANRGRLAGLRRTTHFDPAQLTSS